MTKVLSKQAAEAKLIEVLPQDIGRLSEMFREAGFKLFLVGGCIRDTFLGKMPKDFDVCTDALPGTVIKILTKFNIQHQLRGEQFAVVVAKMSGDEFEIATFREDVSSIDNRHPEIRLGVTIEDDVRRRDFTINALFMDLQERNIIDLVGGVKDLEDGVIRCVGNPADRFREDHLRKLRAVRFKNRTGFKFNALTLDAITNDPDLSISGERIVNELEVAFESALSKSDLLSDLFETRLVHQIFRGMLINDVRDIDVSKAKSFNTFVASIVCPCNDDIAKKLTKLSFTSTTGIKTASSVEFLLKQFHGVTTKPMVFFNKRKSTALTDDEIIAFHGSTKEISWLVSFRPEDGLAEKLMGEGFSNKALGDKLASIFQERFASAMAGNTVS